MKSPFPGMDPFIEGSPDWADFHQSLIVRIKSSLAGAVPARYIVRGEYRSYVEMVETEGKEERKFLPDVSVHEREKRRKQGTGGGLTLAAEPVLTPPLSLRAFIAEEVREAFVEILDKDDGKRLVTALEVLSPSNKAAGTPGREIYLRKRQSLMLGGVNLVELDLLRSGTRMPMLDPWPRSPYVLMVARVRADHRCDVWEADSMRPLPTIPVPLRHPDADIPLDLQALIDGIYQEMAYDRSLDYARRLKPALTDAEKTLLPARPRSRKKEERR